MYIDNILHVYLSARVSPNPLDFPIDRPANGSSSRSFYYEPLAFARNESAENFVFGIDLCPRTSLPENFVSLHYFRTMRTRKTIRDKLRHVDNEENGRGTLADYIDSTLGWVMILKTFSNLNKYFWNATVSFFKKNIIYSCNDFAFLCAFSYIISPFTIPFFRITITPTRVILYPVRLSFGEYMYIYERRKKKVGKSWEFNFLYSNLLEFPNGKFRRDRHRADKTHYRQTFPPPDHDARGKNLSFKVSQCRTRSPRFRRSLIFRKCSNRERERESVARAESWRQRLSRRRPVTSRGPE